MAQNKIENQDDQVPHYEVDQDEAPIQPSMSGISGLASSTLDRASEGIKRGFEEFKRLHRVDVPQRAGNMFEMYHNASYNIDAAGSALRNRSFITFDLPIKGMKRSPKDILVTTRAGTFSSQLKQTVSESSPKIARTISNPKYAQVDSIVVPADKLKRVRDYAQGRLAKPSKSRNPMMTEQGHRQILDKATDRVSVGGASSKPITSKEAISMSEDASVMAKKLNGQALKKTAILAGAASLLGGVVGAATSKETTKMGKAKDALKSAAVAGGGVAATTLAVKGLKTLSTKKGFELLKPLGKGNVAVNVVDMGATVAHQAYKVAKGEATFSEMADACAEKGSSIAGSSGGVMLVTFGAAALSAPGAVAVGAAVVVSVGGGVLGPKIYRGSKRLLTRLLSKEKQPIKAIRSPSRPVVQGA